MPYNEGHYGATSSMTAVLGRMATYSGKIVKWDEAVEKGKQEAPGIESYTWETTVPVVPDEKGVYPGAVPASTTRTFRNCAMVRLSLSVAAGIRSRSDSRSLSCKSSRRMLS